MTCNESHDYMMKYLDNELSNSEHAKLIHHINKCSQCCAELQEYNSIVKVLEEDKDIEPPENFEMAVMSKIRLINNSKKLRGENRLLILFFLFGILLLMGMIVCSVFLKDYILEIMKYSGFPASITYTVYGILNGFANQIKMLIRFVYCFNSIFNDIYYIFVGLFVIAVLSKIYQRKDVKYKSNKSASVLPNK